MFLVRPIARADLPAVLALSERTGTGLTTLPADRERLAARIERSLASFAGSATRADECYVFVLVDAGSDRVAGIAAIEAAVGLAEPFYNFHVGTLVHASRALDVYTVAPTLFLANDHTAHTELCSLFLDQAHRHAKNGPLLAKSRLLFIAEFADRFAPKVIAEMRGRLDAGGRSPFWEGLGRHFFAMEYSTADYLTGLGQKAFIAELMPRHPVYVNLLPETARAAIGEVHADTLPARAMLEQEGFRYEGYVDIFDAGPTLECFRDDIGAVERSVVLPVQLGEEDPVPDSLADSILWLVANRSFAGFRAAIVAASARARPLSAAAVRRAPARRRRRRHRPRGAARAPGPSLSADDAGQLRRHSRPDAQLLGPRARQSRGGEERAAPVESARGGAPGPRQDALAGRAGLRAGRAAAARAAAPAGTARAGLRRRRRGGARPRRARSPRAAGRVLVGGGDVGRQRGDGQPVGRHRRRPGPPHARQPGQPFPPRARGRDDDARAARDLRRPRALRRPRPAAGGAAVR